MTDDKPCAVPEEVVERVKEHFRCIGMSKDLARQCARELMREALSGYTLTKTAAGTVSVPVEPTDEQIEIGEEEIEMRRSHGCGVYASDIYLAMIAPYRKDQP